MLKKNNAIGYSQPKPVFLKDWERGYLHQVHNECPRMPAASRDCPSYVRGEPNRCADKYVAAVDVGTSVLRCHIYDSRARVCGSASEKVELLTPSHGVFEMDPERLWLSFVKTVKSAIHDAGILPRDVEALGIGTQRGTFTTWDRGTGKTYHNLVTWKDVRAEELCRKWNGSFRMLLFKAVMRLLYFLTRKKRFLAASILKFHTGMVAMRLLWALQNVPDLKSDLETGRAVVGTLDTFLLWRLTGGQIHATEPSNACITGLFDPFQVRWSGILSWLLRIPVTMLPTVEDTSGNFGDTEASVFGAPIPVTALAGDQQASTFGECCFEVGDVKCTMGTGTFFDVNTGSKVHASFTGIYPVVGWKINNMVTYLAEGSCFDTGTVIDWARRAGFFEKVEDSSTVASSVSSSEGLYFVPAFSGLQAPVNDGNAASGFLGITVATRKEHMVRAVLESLAFRAKQVYEVLVRELHLHLGLLCFDGGVSRNEFLVQALADILERPVSKSHQSDATSLGVAFLAGLAAGIWKDKEELRALKEGGTVYEPHPARSSTYRPVYEEWQRAVDRFLHWYATR